MDFGFIIGFSLGFIDDLWSNWFYVDLLLMLDDLDVLSLIWLSSDLLVFFFFNNLWVCVLKYKVCVLI